MTALQTWPDASTRAQRHHTNRCGSSAVLASGRREHSGRLERPASLTWPRRCPCLFCDRKLPQCSPSPSNAIADRRRPQRSTGRPRRRAKPRPSSTSSRMCASRGCKVDNGKSFRRSDFQSTSIWSSRRAASSISTSSVSVSGSIHSARLAVSGPYQADGPPISSGNSVIVGKLSALRILWARTTRDPPLVPGPEFSSSRAQIAVEPGY